MFINLDIILRYKGKIDLLEKFKYGFTKIEIVD
mgnify:FL=1|jgi:hypothetical protein